MRFTDYQGLSFDCYGTLINWEAGIAAVLSPWRRIEPVPLGRPEQPTRFPHLLITQVTQLATAALPSDILESLLAATEV